MCRFSCWGPSLCLLLRVAVLWEKRGCREAIRHRGWKVWLQPQKYWIMRVSSTSPQRGESYHTQPCYWQVSWLGKVDCLDSSAVNREENISRMGFVSSWGGWIGKKEWLIFWVCTSVFIHYGGSLVMSYHKVQPCELHETSHTQSTCGKPGLYWRSWGPATTVFRKFKKFGMQPYLKTNIQTPVFSKPIQGSSQKEVLEVSFFKKMISPKPHFWVSGEKSGSLLATRQSVAHFFLKLCSLSVYL